MTRLVSDTQLLGTCSVALSAEELSAFVEGHAVSKDKCSCFTSFSAGEKEKEKEKERKRGGRERNRENEGSGEKKHVPSSFCSSDFAEHAGSQPWPG